MAQNAIVLSLRTQTLGLSLGSLPLQNSTKVRGASPALGILSVVLLETRILRWRSEADRLPYSGWSGHVSGRDTRLQKTQQEVVMQ